MVSRGEQPTKKHLVQSLSQKRHERGRTLLPYYTTNFTLPQPNTFNYKFHNPEQLPRPTPHYHLIAEALVFPLAGGIGELVALRDIRG